MKKVMIILMLTAGSSMFVNAQDTLLQRVPVNWTLENSIAYARQNSITINTQKLSSRSANEDLLQSKAAKLPSLSGAMSQSLVNSTNTDPVVGGFQTQANFSSNYSLSSSIVLFNGGFLKNDIKAKELSLKAANLNVQETENDITLSITQAFLNILLAKENIVYMEEILATSRAQLKQGQQQFDAGSISRKDFLQFESQVASDEYNLVNANNTLRQNTLVLKQLLLLPSTYNFEVTVPPAVKVDAEGQGLIQTQETAQQTRPEIENSEVAVQLAEANLAKVKAGTRPTISLGASLSTGYSDNQANPYLKQLNNNFYQSLGINMSVPIYNKRINKTNIAKNNILIEQARLAQLDTRNTLNQQIEQVYISWQNALAQYTAANTQMKASEETYNITNEQLKYGSVNLVELLQQKNTYVQATQAYIQAKYSSILYGKIYDFYAGVPITF
ncbi:TolC family protein [Paraflavitalea soli]|uniref:TolC family protein n=1 Tax=Paraflavitalea soli TaxID=2315862 RepID=A0A3B7MY71_9BACT|nr:TolC family protein [Paraflavitalea soli]AXY78179.1 TolC family protein [Paraflavitalea soli]